MSEEKENQEQYIFDKKAIDVLIANIIPTSKYFESRFDHLQSQINIIREDIREIKSDMKELEKRIDKRFEQVDKRFEHIEEKLDRILERIDTKIDAGLRENRNLTVKLFTFAMTFAAVSIIGLLGRIFGLF